MLDGLLLSLQFGEGWVGTGLERGCGFYLLLVSCRFKVALLVLLSLEGQHPSLLLAAARNARSQTLIVTAVCHLN